MFEILQPICLREKRLVPKQPNNSKNSRSNGQFDSIIVVYLVEKGRYEHLYAWFALGYFAHCVDRHIHIDAHIYQATIEQEIRK